LSNIGLGDVSVSLAAGTWTVTFQGALTNTDVNQITGNANDLQRVTSPVPASPMTLRFNGQTTAVIPGNATAVQVQAALEALSNIAVGDVLVSGAVGGPWDVQFTGTLANLNVVAIVVNASEVQRVALTGAPTNGVFTLTFNGQTTLPINILASGAGVQTALEALSNIAPGDVIVTGPNLGPWDVTFTGPLANQDVPALIARNNERQQIDPRALTGGNFTLTSTAATACSFNASSAAVTTALENLSNLALGDVSVSLGNGFYVVTFQGTLANQDVPQITATANEIQRVTRPYGANPFTLTFDGQTTGVLAGNATALDVQAALEALTNITPGDIAVTGAAGGPWDIAFAGVYVNQNVPQIVINESEIQTVSLVGAPAGGSFTLTFNNQTTGLIPFDATPAAVQFELESLIGIGFGNVVVTGANGGPWSVAFTGIFASQDVSALRSA
jgi:sorbitol-specific phosphotransferase system component IIA